MPARRTWTKPIETRKGTNYHREHRSKKGRQSNFKNAYSRNRRVKKEESLIEEMEGVIKKVKGEFYSNKKKAVPKKIHISPDEDLQLPMDDDSSEEEVEESGLTEDDIIQEDLDTDEDLL